MIFARWNFNMTKEERLVKKMTDILEEVSDLNGEDIDDRNFREFYENAADELNSFDGEDEDGESDIYQFTFDLLDEYVDLRVELRKLLEARGLDLAQRKEFYRNNLVFEGE